MMASVLSLCLLPCLLLAAAFIVAASVSLDLFWSLHHLYTHTRTKTETRHTETDPPQKQSALLGSRAWLSRGDPPRRRLCCCLLLWENVLRARQGGGSNKRGSARALV